MKPVNILGRIDRVNHQVFVQMLGQRKLYQDTVNLGIRIQLRNQRKQIGLCRICLKPMLDRFHTDLDGHLALGPDIDLGRGISANQNHGQSRRNSVIVLQARNMLAHLLPYTRRKSLAVNDCRCHGNRPSTSLALKYPRRRQERARGFSPAPFS